MMPKVYNERNGDAPADSVYVGIPTVFGNPFTMHSEADRELVVKKHRDWLLSGQGRAPALVAKVKRDLKGKNLVCWCAPLLCHADTLLEIANS